MAGQLLPVAQPCGLDRHVRHRGGGKNVHGWSSNHTGAVQIRAACVAGLAVSTVLYGAGLLMLANAGIFVWSAAQSQGGQSYLFDQYVIAATGTAIGALLLIGLGRVIGLLKAIKQDLTKG